MTEEYTGTNEPQQPQAQQPEPQAQPQQQSQQVYQQPQAQPQQAYQQPQAQAQQAYQQPQQAYQQPQPGYQQSQPVYQQQPIQPVYQQQQPKSATALIVLSVLEILFLGGLFAIIPLVFAVQANSAYKMGDIMGGDAKAKNAKTALIVIAGIGVLCYIALFAMGGFAILSSSR